MSGERDACESSLCEQVWASIGYAFWDSIFVPCGCWRVMREHITAMRRRPFPSREGAATMRSIMKTQTRNVLKSHPTNRINEHEGMEVEQLAPTALVEHLSVPAFLRRTPHRWHLDDMRRFGDKVGQ